MPKLVVLDPGTANERRVWQTFCNWLALIAAAYFGAPLKPVSANEQWAYLHSFEAQEDGWVQLGSEEEARSTAAEGILVLAVMQGAEHGHIAVVLESDPDSPRVTSVCSAGGVNHRRCTLAQSFGATPENPVSFFAYPKGNR